MEKWEASKAERILLRKVDGGYAFDHRLLLEHFAFAKLTPEVIVASLPVSILEALRQRDEVAFERAIVALAPQERQQALTALQALLGSDRGQSKGCREAREHPFAHIFSLSST